MTPPSTVETGCAWNRKEVTMQKFPPTPTIKPGCLSMLAFQMRRAEEYPASPGSNTCPWNPCLNASIVALSTAVPSRRLNFGATTLFLVEMNRGGDENIGGAYYTVSARINPRGADVISASPAKGSDFCEAR